MINVKNLVRKFKSGEAEITVLKELTFQIPTSQFISITGRSGAGKSTLLYQLGLLDKATGGMIVIDGQDVDGLSDEERIIYRRENFGFIFQDYALLPTLTALENVMLPLLMQGIGTKEASEKARSALTQVKLPDKLDNLPSQLSGGQQQRVSIARSIVHGPKILFADEPTANLDTESSKTVLDIFSKLNKQEKLTIVMVTHEQDYAKIAEREMVLSDGMIIKDRLLKQLK